MKKHTLVLIILILIFSSCAKESYWVHIDKTKKAVEKIVLPDKIIEDDPYSKYYVNGDTIISAHYMRNQPLETMYLFKDSICYQQESNIYCSVCADKTIAIYINDKKFDFIKIDETNYVSKKYKDVKM